MAIKENNNNVVLYICMRTDMASMNAGKAVAQGAHAANIFMHEMSGKYAAYEGPLSLREMPGNDAQRYTQQLMQYKEWIGDRGFGTTITLAVDEAELNRVWEVANANNFISGICHDSTYPLRDGAVTHLIPLNTCGYVFGDREQLASILGHLSLM